MKIKISKSQWEGIGKKAGWMKTATDLETLHQQYRSQMQSSKPVYVSLYEISRAYGGPEEGGWWYDERHLISKKKFYDQEEAQKFADKLNAEVDASGANDEDLASSRGLDKYPDPSGGDPMYDHSDKDIPVGFSGLATNLRAVVEEVAGENESHGAPRWE